MFDAAEVPPCPRCGLIDKVASVPAVYRAGFRQVRVHVPDPEGPLHGPGEYALRSVPTPLGAALAPAPAPTGTQDALGVSLVAFLLCLVGAPAFIIGWHEHSTGSCLFGAVALLAAVLVVVLGVRRHQLFAREHEERRARSEQVWRQAWYCSRCGTAHFLPNGPTGISRAMTFDELRQLVWGAGGFALPGVFHPTGTPTGSRTRN